MILAVLADKIGIMALPPDILPDPMALVLVCLLPEPRDLDIARTLGWYRIPLRRAPKVVAVDYLAFYQPASFGDRKWRVEYLAPVMGHELAVRGELLNAEQDHPRAQDEYFKISIGPLRRLPNPIGAGRWRRFSFLYTTGAYLSSASTLKDLVLVPEDRPHLWRALRDRGSGTQGYRSESLPSLPLNTEQLASLLGIVAGLES